MLNTILEKWWNKKNMEECTNNLILEQMAGLAEVKNCTNWAKYARRELKKCKVIYSG